MLNAAGEPLRTPQRLKNARNSRLHWIDQAVDDWPTQVRAWLLEAGAQLELAA